MEEAVYTVYIKKGADEEDNNPKLKLIIWSFNKNQWKLLNTLYSSLYGL